MVFGGVGGEKKKEEKGGKSGRAASRRRRDARRRPLAGFEAIIQLVKVSGRVTAHKTNMIAAANCCEPTEIQGPRVSF